MSAGIPVLDIPDEPKAGSAPVACKVCGLIPDNKRHCCPPIQNPAPVERGTYYKREHGKEDGDKYTIVRYTHAKPAKVCVWVQDKASIATNGHTACGWWMDRDSQFNFCPRCGGKIKVKR